MMNTTNTRTSEEHTDLTGKMGKRKKKCRTVSNKAKSDYWVYVIAALKLRVPATSPKNAENCVYDLDYDEPWKFEASLPNDIKLEDGRGWEMLKVTGVTKIVKCELQDLMAAPGPVAPVTANTPGFQLPAAPEGNVDDSQALWVTGHTSPPASASPAAATNRAPLLAQPSAYPPPPGQWERLAAAKARLIAAQVGASLPAQ